PSTCQTRLEKLKGISAQLIEITTAKAAHASARIDAELNALSSSGRSRTAEQPAGKVAPRTATQTEPSPKSQPMSAAPALTPPKTRDARPMPPAEGGWDTDTVRHAAIDEADHVPPPEVLADLPPYVHQSEEL